MVFQFSVIASLLVGIHGEADTQTFPSATEFSQVLADREGPQKIAVAWLNFLAVHHPTPLAAPPPTARKTSICCVPGR
jgi:hypothetical protein